MRLLALILATAQKIEQVDITDQKSFGDRKIDVKVDKVKKWKEEIRPKGGIIYANSEDIIINERVERGQEER